MRSLQKTIYYNGCGCACYRQYSVLNIVTSYWPDTGFRLIIEFNGFLLLFTTDNYNTSAALHHLQKKLQLTRSLSSVLYLHILIAWLWPPVTGTLPSVSILDGSVWLSKFLPALASTVILGFGSHRTHDHIFLSQDSGSRALTPSCSESHWMSLNSFVTGKFGNTASNSSSSVVCVFVSAEAYINKLLHSNEHLCDTSYYIHVINLCDSKVTLWQQSPKV
jgi:hypothetical protein